MFRPYKACMRTWLLARLQLASLSPGQLVLAASDHRRLSTLSSSSADGSCLFPLTSWYIISFSHCHHLHQSSKFFLNWGFPLFRDDPDGNLPDRQHCTPPASSRRVARAASSHSQTLSGPPAQHCQENPCFLEFYTKKLMMMTITSGT